MELPSQDLDLSGKSVKGTVIGGDQRRNGISQAVIKRLSRNGAPSEERRNARMDGYGVLIFDSSAMHAESIVDELESAEITATAFQNKQLVFEFMDTHQVDLAVMVIHSEAWWRDELRLFVNSIRYLQEKAEIICLLPWPEECPLDRLYGDTLNVTVLHGR